MVLSDRQKKTLRSGDIYVKNRSGPLKNGFAVCGPFFSSHAKLFDRGVARDCPWMI
jgi:hypothetical protein